MDNNSKSSFILVLGNKLSKLTTFSVEEKEALLQFLIDELKEYKENYPEAIKLPHSNSKLSLVKDRSIYIDFEREVERILEHEGVSNYQEVQLLLEETKHLIHKGFRGSRN